MTAQHDQGLFGQAAAAQGQVPRQYPPILHIHIPKTGGQALGKRLAAGVPAGKAWYLQGDLTTENRMQLDEFAGTKAVVSAHVHTGVLEHESRFAFAATVRDPLEQIVSNYLHVLRDPSNEYHTLFANLPAARAVELSRAMFSDFQTRSLVSCFHRLGAAELLVDEKRFLAARVLDAADRLTWLAPIEDLDELCILMSLQTGYNFARERGAVNTAGNRSDPRADELRELLAARPELYALDLLLYQEAQRRHQELRIELLDSICPAPADGQAGTVFVAGGESIQALDGWWLPCIEVAPWGHELRAGPQLSSTLRIRRCHESRWLCFDIAFVAGIEAGDLLFIDRQRGSFLPFRLIEQGSTRTVAVDISDCSALCEIVVRVPRIFALARFNGEWNSSDNLVSLGTRNWRLVEAPPHSGED